VVTARDEEPAIARTVKALSGVAGVAGVVVVDDGSSDRTAEDGRGAGARVLRTPARLGKGRALEQALDRMSPADVYLLVDGDVSDTASEVAALLAPVLRGDLDLAVAAFPPLAEGGFGLVKGIARMLIRRATGFEAREPLSGQRAITSEALAGCRPLAAGFGLETAMTIDAARLGFRIGEIPVAMTHRPTGRGVGGFLHRARQGVDILRAALPRLVGLR
jgi:glycosyltransferase involved in cell wall biosynthesis